MYDIPFLLSLSLSLIYFCSHINLKQIDDDSKKIKTFIFMVCGNVDPCRSGECRTCDGERESSRVGGERFDHGTVESLRPLRMLIFQHCAR